MTDDFEFNIAALKREQSKYHEALGHLFLAWAQLEGALFGVLVHYAKVSPAIGRSVFSGLRAKLMQEHIDRIGENSTISPARRRDLKFLFAQIALINTMRDWVAHYGELNFFAMVSHEASEGYQYVSNEKRAGRQDKALTHKLDAQLVMSMVGDLARINQDLRLHMKRRFIVNPRSGDATTWLYRSPQPVSQTKRPRTATPKQRKSHEKN